MRADLHLHTTASDGTESAETLIEKAHEKGIDVIAITDHDTVGALKGAREALPEGMTLIDAAEFSCVFTDSREKVIQCHILGYGIDYSHPAITDIIREGYERRIAKLMARIEYIEAEFGVKLKEEDIEYLRSMNSSAKPHLARVMMKYGCGDSVPDVIKNYLSKAKTPDSRIDAEKVIKAIHSAGGYAIYAHPLGGEMERHLDKEEFTIRAEYSVSLGIDGFEAYYSRYSESEERMICEFSEQRGLLISGGSDYHGENKTVALGSLREDMQLIDAEKITLLSKIL